MLEKRRNDTSSSFAKRKRSKVHLLQLQYKYWFLKMRTKVVTWTGFIVVFRELPGLVRTAEGKD